MPDARRPAADALAASLAGAAARQWLDHLEALGWLTPGQSELAAAEPLPPAPRPIRIWQPRQGPQGTTWVRPAPAPFGDHYASVPVLTPRRGERPRRVAWFGESAAAGYLYAPWRTPAKLLAATLCGLDGAASWEVIDLARTNDTLVPMLAAIEASLQLDPDALVLYAGNNWTLLETPGWSPYAREPADRRRYAEALAESAGRGDGVLGPIEAARRELCARAGETLERLAELARARALPVVVVVPEVNLADWETCQPVSWLPGTDTARWYRLWSAVEQGLAKGRLEEAIALAWQMVDLDRETCPTSCWLLARAYRQAGDEARARAAAIAAVDAGHYANLACLAAPQATSVVRELLQRAAGRFGWRTVDLRTLFGQLGGGELPGRRWFLDYCHLSAEGTEALAAAVAAELTGSAGEGAATTASFERALAVARREPCPPEVEATAQLGAAIHGAHRQLPLATKGPALAAAVRAALAASPLALGTISEVLAARGVPGPAVLAAAQGRNLRSALPLGFQHGWRWEELDADLWQALASELAAHDPAAAHAAQARLLRHHAVEAVAPDGRHRGRDLSCSPYLWEPLARFFPEVMAEGREAARAFHRSPLPTSSFILASEGGGGDVALEIVLRVGSGHLAAQEARAKVAIRLNGRPLGSLPVGCRWQRQRFLVPAAALCRGLNRLDLDWPLPLADGAAQLDLACQELAAGRPADVHPAMGEVYALRAEPAE